MTTERIAVAVAYARPDEQLIIPLELESGASVRTAIERSAIAQHFPEIDLETAKVGIFGKAVGLDDQLSSGDRVEIYRPLIADPKEIRRKRAEEGRRTTKGGGANPGSGPHKSGSAESG